MAIEPGTWRKYLTSRFLHLMTLRFPQSSHSVNVFVLKSQVLSELEFTLHQKEHNLQSNPYDTIAQNHISILSQVCLTKMSSLAFSHINAAMQTC